MRESYLGTLGDATGSRGVEIFHDFFVEEGWSPWKEVSEAKYRWALGRWDYTTQVTE